MIEQFYLTHRWNYQVLPTQGIEETGYLLSRGSAYSRAPDDRAVKIMIYLKEKKKKKVLLFVLVLWHINHCWLFDAKSCLYIYIK